MKQKIIGLDIETQPNWALWESGVYPEFDPKPLEYKLGNLADEEKIEAKKKIQESVWQKEEAKRLAEYTEKKRKKFSIDPNLCEVVCVCLWEEPSAIPYSIKSMDEKTMLRHMWDYLLDSDSAKTIVTKNGVGFDIPILLVRSQIHRILTHEEVQRIHSFYLGAQWNRESHHIDIQEQPGGKASLDVLAKVWLGEEKIDISTKIIELMGMGKIDEIIKGCKQHARLAHDIGKMMMLY